MGILRFSARRPLRGGGPIQSPLQTTPNPAKWIEELVHHPLLQWNDGIVGDLDALRANLRATLGDVAVADSLRSPQFLDPVFGVERMHFQRSDVNQKAR